MAAGVLSFYLRAARWRQLLLPLDPSISRLKVFNAVNIGNIANFVFARIGEFVRCGVIAKAPAKVSEEAVATYDKVLGTVVLERMWDVIVMALLAGVLIAARWEKFGSFIVEKMWLPATQSLNFSLWWVVGAVVLVAIVGLYLIIRLRDRNKIFAWVYKVLHGIWEGVLTAFRMEHKWKFILHTVLIWAMYWLMAVCIMNAIPELGRLSAVDALFLMIAGSFGWLVPVPGGFGAFHFIVSLALSTIYGIPFELGIIFATLSHEAQAVTMVVTGIGSYIWETTRSKK